MSDFKADLNRYGGWKAFLREQSIWAVAVYRLGRKMNRGPKLIKVILRLPYYLVFRFIETFTGVSIPVEASIGKGLRIWHFGQIFINGDAVIGENCTLRQGVTIGNKVERGGSPVVGDNVEFGAYSMAIGDIKIENNCKIGAYTLVNKDMPFSAVAVGIPCKISLPKTADEVGP